MYYFALFYAESLLDEGKGTELHRCLLCLFVLVFDYVLQMSNVLMKLFHNKSLGDDCRSMDFLWEFATCVIQYLSHSLQKKN